MRKLYSPSVIMLLAIAFSSMFANNSFAQTNENNAKPKWTNGNPFEHKLFIENKGQFDKKDTLANSNILYGVTLGEIQIYFTSSGLTYRRDEFAKGDEEDREEAVEKMKEGGKKMSDKIAPHLIKLVWEGASPDAEIVAEDKADYFFSYPDVNDPTYKKSYEAQAYKKITYRNLYPNIDVVYYFPEGQSGIKYSIILHPGANPSVIKMKYSGECNSELDHEGNLILSSVFIGDFTDHAPQTYYQNNNGAIL